MSGRCVLICVCCMLPGAGRNWPALTQKPYAAVPIQDLGLKPLLPINEQQQTLTPKDWSAVRRGLVKDWLACLGRPPTKARTLDVRIEATEKLEGYTRQLLSFKGTDDDRILCYLLIPDGIKKGERRPAAVVFHQTTSDTLKEPVGLGKNSSLAIGLHLVQRGYVVLCPQCFIMKDGGPKAQAEAIARRWPGWTGLGKMTFDAARCVDFLESLAFVDHGRVGCIGHSLGAKEVLFAMAFDARVQAGVFSEGGIGLRMSNWTDPWYLTGAMKPRIPRLENHQVLALIAPRPFLLVGGDAADGDASWTFIHATLPVYRLLQADDRLGFFNHHRKHTFPENARKVAYEWLDSWLRRNP